MHISIQPLPGGDIVLTLHGTVPNQRSAKTEAKASLPASGCRPEKYLQTNIIQSGISHNRHPGDDSQILLEAYLLSHGMQRCVTDALGSRMALSTLACFNSHKLTKKQPQIMHYNGL